MLFLSAWVSDRASILGSSLPSCANGSVIANCLWQSLAVCYIVINKQLLLLKLLVQVLILLFLHLLHSVQYCTGRHDILILDWLLITSCSLVLFTLEMARGCLFNRKSNALDQLTIIEIGKACRLHGVHDVSILTVFHWAYLLLSSFHRRVGNQLWKFQVFIVRCNIEMMNFRVTNTVLIAYDHHILIGRFLLLISFFAIFFLHKAGNPGAHRIRHSSSSSSSLITVWHAFHFIQHGRWPGASCRWHVFDLEGSGLLLLRTRHHGAGSSGDSQGRFRH